MEHWSISEIPALVYRSGDFLSLTRSVKRILTGVGDPGKEGKGWCETRGQAPKQVVFFKAYNGGRIFSDQATGERGAGPCRGKFHPSLSTISEALPFKTLK